MFREELALVKQNGAWKPWRKKGWSGLFYPPNGLNFQFCWFNLIFLIAPNWSESNFTLFLFFLFDPSWSESIRVDPTRTGGPSWSGPTFVPAYSVALSAANVWPNCKEFSCSYPHDLAVLCSTHETLKYDKVNWNRCTWCGPRLNQRFSSTGASCDDQISRQTKRGMHSDYLSQQHESITQQHLAGIFV